MNDISNTALLTLQCHVLDAQRATPVLNDQSSITTLQWLEKQLEGTEKALLSHKVKRSLVSHTAIRAKQYDRYVTDFLKRYPRATIVNIGCGLDHRFERVDNGQCVFWDLDLPDIIGIKQELFTEGERYRQIAQSVFETSWMGKINSKHVMLLAEGVFMYCSEDDIKTLFQQIKTNFPGAEMVCEVFNSKWLTGWRRKSMETKLKKQLNLGDDAVFKSGIPDSDEMENWDRDYRLLDDWSYLDSDELDSFALKLFRNNDNYRKIQWTVHYQIGR